MLAKKKKRNVKLQKRPRQMERYLKGVANHRRIEMLCLVAEEKGLSVERIADELKCNFKTVSMHSQRLVQAGLLKKHYEGREVIHSLSPYGEKMYKFILKF